MSCWNKAELEQMLEDVVSELDLSDAAIAEHGPLGTSPAELVKLVLHQKDSTIRYLRAGMVDCTAAAAVARAERAEAALARRTAERDRMREWTSRNVGHLEDCSYWLSRNGPKPCDCGFTAALADEPEVKP